jgi:fatty acid desaturase
MVFYMIIVSVMVSLALLGVIVRFALSKSSEKPVKQAAVIALAAISLAVIVCLILVVSGPGAVEEEPVFAGLPLAEPVQVDDPAAPFILVSGIVLLLFLGVVIFFALKDKRPSPR